MTDKVIEELQNASKWFAEHGRNTNTAIIGICGRAVDKINRQRAEIERLHNILLSFTNEVSMWSNKNGYDTSGLSLIPILDKAKNIKAEIRAEAVKEFAVRLKGDNFKTPVDAYNSAYLLGDEDIDNIIKEMVGEQG